MDHNIGGDAFADVRFDGDFRPYQSEVLAHADEYLQDKKIHIVAAPGAGKTVLGLELIRRLGRPALILSPTVTIRSQWVQRFCERFLPENADRAAYVSEDICAPALIVSSTYQAMYSAMRGLKDTECDELTGKTETTDYAGTDLKAILRRGGVGTVCLDEAHHLHREWHKALTELLSDTGVAVVALTATPPYDGDAGEWKRYTDLCGEIDFEIVAPELVQAGALCPHQDYVYFNYPAKEELREVKAYYARADAALSAFGESGFPARIAEKVAALPESELYRSAKENIRVCSLLHAFGVGLPKKFIKKLTLRGDLPRADRELTESALNYIAAREDLFGKELSEGVYSIFADHRLTERRRIRLSGSEKLDRALASSVGKLHSAAEAARLESLSMREDLRMLVLTDYVRVGTLSLIGSRETLTEISVISLFEAIRRRDGTDKALGIVSGALTVLPQASLKRVYGLCSERGVTADAESLGITEYCKVCFSGGNRVKVDIVTRLLEEGVLHILIGTKALLGEGWDSPCVNTLIMASFVGSYVLSNQMRGRAIRSDPSCRAKVSNIWHLATVEPDGLFDRGAHRVYAKIVRDENSFVSSDYETLKRRFEAFWGPSYSEDVVTNGIARVVSAEPPFTKKKFEELNRKAEERAADRAAVAESWKRALGENALSVTAEIGAGKRKGYVQKSAAFINFTLLLVCAAVQGAVAAAVWGSASAGLRGAPLWAALVIAAAAVAGIVFLEYALIRFLTFALVPRKTIRRWSEALLETLKSAGVVSHGAYAEICAPKGAPGLAVSLLSASGREQQIFIRAMRTMLSPVDDPVYLIVKSGVGKFGSCFACPDVFKNADEVRSFCSHLRKKGWKAEYMYTRTEKGRKALILARKRSFLNVNDAGVLTGRKKISPRFK